MFTDSFRPYAYEGDSISCIVDGFTVTATIYRDDDSGSPETRDGGFWPSLNPQAAGYIGSKSEAELIKETAKAQAILDAWRNDEWFYCGICVRVSKEGIDLTGKCEHALWGVECNYPDVDNSYLLEVANDLLSEALDDARKTLSKLCEGTCQ